MPPEKLENLLNSSENGGLVDVVRRARTLGSLTETLSKALPDELRTALVGANVREDGVLVVIARSPAWAARLRYEQDALLTAACASGGQVERVSVRVAHDV